MTTYYTIESEHGDQIATGIPTATAAAHNAQRIADQTGRTVYWGEDCEGGEMHEVRPSTWNGDVEDGLPREHTVHGTVTSPSGEVHDVSVRLTRGPRYSIRIYDGDPASFGGGAWPTHDGTPLDAETLAEAREEAIDILRCEGAGLSRDDGYEVGQRIYAMIDAADDSGSDCVSYELTVDDLGEEDEEGDRELRSWLADREASR